MNKIKHILVIALALISFSVDAQNEIEALRFSRHQTLGSARYMALGGAFGALGADPSVLSQNPAGIALYRRNEFAFSLGLNSMNSSNDFMGNTREIDNFHTRLNGVSMISNRESSSPDISRISFGMGFNRLINFDNSYTFEGTVNGNTLLDVLVTQAAGNTPSSLATYPNTALYSSPAYEAWLISPTDSTGGAYYHEIPHGEILQKKTIQTTGHLGELTFNMGINMDEKIFLGAAVAFPMVSYEENTNYQEIPLGDSISLDNYRFKEQTYVDGRGINLKLGAIFRPVNWLRFGLAYHSPTRLTLNQSKNTSFHSSFDNGTETHDVTSDFVDYGYTIKSPSRYQVNTAFIIKKKGSIAVDYEYVNYQNSALRSSGFDDYSFEVENNTINRIYTGASQVKIGAEYRITKTFTLRGGANYQESPYVPESSPIDADVMSYSGGLGYRYQGFYIDFAYIQANTSLAHYSYNNVSPATLNKTTGQGVLTLGFRY